MPLKPNNFRADAHSFGDDYYRHKFTIESMELFKELERNPNNLVAKEQLEYIKEVFKRGNENNKAGEPFDWSATWWNFKSNILPSIKNKHMDMNTKVKVKNEDWKFVPINTRCAKCYKTIYRGILQEGFNMGSLFNCEECYLKNKKRLEDIENGN